MLIEVLFRSMLQLRQGQVFKTNGVLMRSGKVDENQLSLHNSRNVCRIFVPSRLLKVG